MSTLLVSEVPSSPAVLRLCRRFSSSPHTSPLHFHSIRPSIYLSIYQAGFCLPRCISLGRVHSILLCFFVNISTYFLAWKEECYGGSVRQTQKLSFLLAILILLSTACPRNRRQPRRTCFLFPLLFSQVDCMRVDTFQGREGEENLLFLVQNCLLTCISVESLSSFLLGVFSCKCSRADMYPSPCRQRGLALPPARDIHEDEVGLAGERNSILSLSLPCSVYSYCSTCIRRRVYACACVHARWASRGIRFLSDAFLSVGSIAELPQGAATVFILDVLPE